MPRRKTHAEFIEEMTLKHPSIEVLGRYKNSSTQIEVKCKTCGHDWATLPSNLVNTGTGCPRCACRKRGKASRMDANEFTRRLYDVNPLIIVSGQYQGTGKRIRVICKRCGYEWEAWPSGLLRGGRCPACSHGHTSFAEQFIAEALRRQFGNEKIESPNRTLIGKELDIFIPSAKIAIEPGSWFWHRKKISRDAEKRKLSHEKGVRLITIYDAYPAEKAAPFPDDCWIFTNDLGSEVGHATLKTIVADLITIIDPCSIPEDIDWKEVEHLALLRSGMRSTEDFVSELKSIRDDIEILSNYAGSNAPIMCRCKKCGHEWSPTPHSLLSQQSGCPKCAGSLKKTTEQFKKELEKINPNIEVLGEYGNIQSNIECRCKICGHIWYPRPLGLLNGTGCPNCYRMRPSPIKKEASQFLEEISALNPDIEIVGDYSGSAERIAVRCVKCGHEWNPTANSLLSGHGCPKCGGALKKSTEQFVRDLDQVNPDVEVLGDYITSKTKIRCRCKLCGNEWSPTPNDLLRGRRCPKCRKSNIY